MATPFSDAEIKAFIEENANNPALIRQTAIDTGTSVEEIERAIGAPAGFGNQWLRDQGLEALPEIRTVDDPTGAGRNLIVVPSQPSGTSRTTSRTTPSTTPRTTPSTTPSTTPRTTPRTSSAVPPSTSRGGDVATAPTDVPTTTTTPSEETAPTSTPTEVISVPRAGTPGEEIYAATGLSPTEHMMNVFTQPGNRPGETFQTFTPMEVRPGEIMSVDNPNLIADAQQRIVSSTAEASMQSLQQALDVAQVDAALIGEGAAGTTEAAQGTVSPLAMMEPAQRNLSSLATAAQGETPREALVSHQLEQLISGIEGGNIPNWAQPAVAAVEQQLAARGISRSSVGRAQLTNAIIQSAIPLAQQNAQTEAQTFWKNLDNRQQTAIVNAQNLAQMDLANLNARQQAQVTNAQSFLQMDLANLSNEQQVTMFDAQIRQQSYLSDQAALNAASQINAANQNQADQFIANLNANIEQQNASRATAISQFNAQQANALEQFNTSLEAQREQFNVQNNIAIEQSNTAWRRQTNQINTAGINAVNQANAMNAFNLSNQALTFLWQEYRDAAKWEFDAGQNQANREVQLAMAALGNESATDANKSNAIAALGAAAFNFFGS